MANQGPISITLTRDEALVLLEILGDFRDEPVVTVRDQAERHALWNLTCLLEKAVPEVLSPKYDEQLAIAKKNLSP